MNMQQAIKQALQAAVPPVTSAAIFFKTGPGGYAEHDQFIGITVPVLRMIAKQFRDISLVDISWLFTSPINEYRQLALFVLVDQYQRADKLKKQELYQYYLDNLAHVNNWNLVDASAHLIIGKHLIDKDKQLLQTLAVSPRLWERRVAIVATWWFIRNDQFEWTLKIATILLKDRHDLIHKAVGWMLREMGKRNVEALKIFLHEHAHHMPRTMLRYAIEKFSPEERARYLGR